MKLRLRGTREVTAGEVSARLVAGLHVVTSAESTPPGTLVPGVVEVDEGAFVGAWMSPAAARSLDRVTSGLGDSTTWEEWTAASHVVAPFEGDVALTELERSLEANLGALQTVCRAPRTHLRHDEERTPVSRARRISSRTIADLVARPVDWEHRTLRSIRPSSVLSVVPEDDWDLYENRVAARLVDRLLALLTPRLEELGNIRALLDDGNDFSDETRGSHWRVRRLELTWSRVVSDDSLRARVTATLRKVGALTDAVRALVASPLYSRVPRAAQVDDTLRPTNILVNDLTYRKVADLWRLAALARAERTPSRDEVVRRRREASARLDAFATLLVLQALRGIGYSADGDARFRNGPMHLHGARGALRVRHEADGSVTVLQGDHALSVVALPVEPSADTAASIWEVLRGTSTPDTLVLLYGRPEAMRAREDLDGEARRALAGWSWPRALVVSPWSLDAIERVARVLGAWDARGRLEPFPPRVPWTGSVPEGMPTWARASKGWLAVAQPPDAPERERFELDLRRREAPLARARGAGRDGRRDVDGHEERSLRALRTLLERAGELVWLRRCPVCNGHDTRVDDRWQEGLAPERQGIWCRCDGCGAAWGLRACGACHGRFEVLDPGVNISCPDDVAQIDRTYGRDLWCAPDAGSRSVFRCPYCVVAQLDAQRDTAQRNPMVRPT